MKFIEELQIIDSPDGHLLVPTGKAAEIFKGVMHLNESGANIISGLLEGKASDDIAQEMMFQYSEVTKEQLLEEIGATVATLKREGLVLEE